MSDDRIIAFELGEQLSMALAMVAKAYGDTKAATNQGVHLIRVGVGQLKLDYNIDDHEIVKWDLGLRLAVQTKRPDLLPAFQLGFVIFSLFVLKSMRADSSDSDESGQLASNDYETAKACADSLGAFVKKSVSEYIEALRTESDLQVLGDKWSKTSKSIVAYINETSRTDSKSAVTELISGTDNSYDVFLSYASGDNDVAIELKNAFERKGMRCFMAEKDISVAFQWEVSIRDTLATSRWVLLLLTPRSITRPWILIESGAAWALGKDIIPALVHVSPEDLIDPIRRYQARVIETTSQRNKLIKELSMK